MFMIRLFQTKHPVDLNKQEFGKFTCTGDMSPLNPLLHWVLKMH